MREKHRIQRITKTRNRKYRRLGYVRVDYRSLTAKEEDELGRKLRKTSFDGRKYKYHLLASTNNNKINGLSKDNPSLSLAPTPGKYCSDCHYLTKNCICTKRTRSKANEKLLCRRTKRN